MTDLEKLTRIITRVSWAMSALELGDPKDFDKQMRKIHELAAPPVLKEVEHVYVDPTAKYRSECPEGYSTILEWYVDNTDFVSYNTDNFNFLADPNMFAWDGKQLTELCRLSNRDVIKVDAPAVFAERHIHEVNAYPIDMLNQWFVDNNQQAF